jgi:hypothetical protein
MKKLLRYALGTTTAVALAFGASTTASAAMIAAVCQDLTCTNAPIIVTDNQAGDTIAAPGAINFTTSAFGYSLLVNTAQSKPIIGSATLPQLDLTFTATGTGTIFLYTGDTDFLNPQSFLLSLAQTSSGGSGTVTGRAWGGSTNNALTFSPLLASIGPLSGAASSGTASGSYTPAVNPYSLGIGVQINRTTAGTTTGDLNFAAVAIPEPATWGLMMLGFGGVGAILRRRRMQPAFALT